jgi:hypothetical protein
MADIYDYLKSWQLKKNSKAVHLLIHLASSAAKTPTIRNREKTERGQVKTSIRKLASETGMTYAEARGTLLLLVKAGDVNMLCNQYGTTITVLSYSKIFIDKEPAKSPGQSPKAIEKAKDLLDHLAAREEFKGKNGMLEIKMPINCGGVRTPVVTWEEGKSRVVRLGVEAEVFERERIYG